MLLSNCDTNPVSMDEQEVKEIMQERDHETMTADNSADFVYLPMMSARQIARDQGT